MNIMKGKQVRSRRILLYGQHGVGKSTWAAGAPEPIFLNIEDGIGDLDVSRTAHLKDYGQVVDAISWLIQNQTEFQTVVIDTIDWLEHLIFKKVATDAGKTKIEDIGYGKGYKNAVELWHFLLNGLNVLRDNGKHIILLAHAKEETFESPETERYDRYEPDVHALSSSLVQEWCDEVLFASFRIFVRQEDKGFDRKRGIAGGGKDRYIRTDESASALAKNRLGLPGELPMNWADYAAFLPKNQPENISGVVKDGSSKKQAAASN